MKYLKVLQPNLPNGVTVTATSWRVNDKADMTGNVILNALNDTTNLFQKAIPVEMSDSDIWYANMTHHLSNGTEITSDTIILTKYSENSPRQIFVYPPKVTYSILGDGTGLDLAISEPKFYYNTSNHISTSWRLLDSDGIAFYKRERDTFNKLKLNIEKEVYKHKDTFTIEAVYHFEQNDIEVTGREHVTLRTKGADLSLSRNSLISGTDNVVKVYGFKYAVTSAIVSYIIDDFQSEKIIVSKLNSGFVIPANLLKNSGSVRVHLEYGSNDSLDIDLDIVSLDLSNMRLSSNASVVTTRAIIDIDWTNRQPVPLIDNKMIISDGNRDILVNRSNRGRITEIASDTIGIKAIVKDPIRDKFIIRTADKIKILTDLKSFTVEESINDIILSNANYSYIQVINNSIYFNDSLNKIYSTPIPLATSTEQFTVDINYNFDFYITDTIRCKVKDNKYQFTGKDPILIPLNYSNYQYIISDIGLYIIASDYTSNKVTIFHVTPDSMWLIDDIQLESLRGIPAVAYDVNTDKIHIVYNS